MIDLDFSFNGKIWLWKEGSWHFITLPTEISADIRAFTKHKNTGFGSLKVEAKTGDTVWKTSIFPSKKHNAYLLPIKKAVREKEHIDRGDSIEITIKVLT